MCNTCMLSTLGNWKLVSCVIKLFKLITQDTMTYFKSSHKVLSGGWVVGLVQEGVMAGRDITFMWQITWWNMAYDNFL